MASNEINNKALWPAVVVFAFAAFSIIIQEDASYWMLFWALGCFFLSFIPLLAFNDILKGNCDNALNGCLFIAGGSLFVVLFFWGCFFKTVWSPDLKTNPNVYIAIGTGIASLVITLAVKKMTTIEREGRRLVIAAAQKADAEMAIKKEQAKMLKQLEREKEIQEFEIEKEIQELEKRELSINTFETKTILDEFSGFKSIVFKNICDTSQVFLKNNSENDKGDKCLRLSFSHDWGKNFINLYSNAYENYNAATEVSFLFENGEKIVYTKLSRPTEFNVHSKYFKEITQTEFNLFLEYKLKKWKVNNGGNIYLGVADDDFSKALQNMANHFNDELQEEVPDNLFINERAELSQSPNPCYIYLMHDTTTDCYKIGISNKPKYREKTLQSEKPSIEMLAAKEYPTRKLASAFEISLHESYKESRVRGEWFKFTQNEVDQILDALK